MNKRELKKFEKLLAGMAKVNSMEVEEIKETAGLNTVYSHDEQVYETQSVLNFFQSRIAPRIEAKEPVAAFDKRFHEWRFKDCKQCRERFAYAYHYDGVAYCSLDCMDEALKAIGLQATRGRDLKKRWGARHPAIVPSTALAALETLYGSSAPDAFELSER